MIYGTFLESSDPGISEKKSSRNFTIVGAIVGMTLLATVLVVSFNSGATHVELSDIDRDDGTTALVNAILIARADKFSTKEASDVLGIDPELPFLGASAYASKRHHESKAAPAALKQRTQKLWMPNQLAMSNAVKESPALFQQLEVDPSTQFCSDPDDCLRNDDYFKENAEWHQAAHDMIMNPTGAALPPNLPGMAWCDRELDPSC